MDDPRRIDDGIPYGSLERNRRHRFAYRVAHQSDGTDLRFPVNVVAGDADGPRVVCVAGIHGDEPEGVAASMHLWTDLDPNGIRGTVVFVPAANPPAFRARTRTNSDDDRDMNRVFPGDDTGTATERLAHHLFEGVARGADCVVSLHSVGTGSLVVPYVEYAADSPVAVESRAMADAFGAPYVDPFEWPASSRRSARKQGSRRSSRNSAASAPRRPSAVHSTSAGSGTYSAMPDRSRRRLGVATTSVR